jgi:hypothetical protein
MGGKSKTTKPGAEKRVRWDRRDPLRDRRMIERRRTERRKSGRRKDFCPTCGGELTPTAYCSSCKIRVVKIRVSSKH